MEDFDNVEVLEEVLVKPKKTSPLANKTPEEMQAIREKAAATRKGNTYKKKKFEKTINQILTAKVQGQDVNGKIRMMTMQEKMLLNIVLKATSPDDKQAVAAFREVREIMGETNKEPLIQLNSNSIEVKFSADIERLAR